MLRPLGTGQTLSRRGPPHSRHRALLWPQRALSAELCGPGPGLRLPPWGPDVASVVPTSSQVTLAYKCS